MRVGLGADSSQKTNNYALRAQQNRIKPTHNRIPNSKKTFRALLVDE